MTSSDEKIRRWIIASAPYHRVIGIALLIAYMFINNTINAVSDWTELSRNQSNSVNMWEPFVWEYSSALSSSLLLMPIFWCIVKLDNRSVSIRFWLLTHLVIASVVSIFHVSIMVMLRKMFYWMMSMEYNFGPIMREFVYEYRKDIWGYLTLITFYYVMTFTCRRLMGEASPLHDENVGEAITNHNTDLPENLLVKKLNREFLVKLSDVNWVEAAGNYINLHTSSGVYPLRYTMKAFSDKAKVYGFNRVHRSYIIANNAIEHIQYDESGDGVVKLKDGTEVLLSRRYKEQLKTALSPRAC